VNVTAKVVNKQDTVYQNVRNKKFEKTGFVIADRAPAVELTLWGPPEQILVSASYKFENVTVKAFETKILTTTMNTRITKA
jgi:hypothetical protein